MGLSPLIHDWSCRLLKSVSPGRPGRLPLPGQGFRADEPPETTSARRSGRPLPPFRPIRRWREHLLLSWRRSSRCPTDCLHQQRPVSQRPRPSHRGNREQGQTRAPASRRTIADAVIASGVAPFGVGSTSQIATGCGDQLPRSPSTSLTVRFVSNGALRLRAAHRTHVAMSTRRSVSGAAMCYPL